MVLCVEMIDGIAAIEDVPGDFGPEKRDVVSARKQSARKLVVLKYDFTSANAVQRQPQTLFPLMIEPKPPNTVNPIFDRMSH